MMKIKVVLLFIFAISLLSFPQTVFYARLEGEVDLGMAPYVKRVLEEANAKQVSAVIFEINTFGGRVDAATQIKDAILESNVTTIAFVNKRAVSAGALISLSCTKIVMASGSLIGASTVVDQDGKKQSEKYQAYMRSEMRSTAEKRGRRADIAEGMVDERVIVTDMGDDSTKLISLTYSDAQRFQICDTVLESKAEILKYLGMEYATLVDKSESGMEKFVGFLNNPIISSLLIMIGLVGIYAEIKAPGLGFSGIAGLIALTLFFGSSYLLQLASMWEILLFILGLILLALEIFLIPGFGVTGVLGIALMIGSIFFSLFSFGPDINESISGAVVQLAATLLMTIGIISLLVKYLPKSTRFLKLTLQAENTSDSGFVSSENYASLLGSEGITYTPLRPAGVAIINGEKFDVLADGNFIEKNVAVKIVKVMGGKITVSVL